MAEFNVRISREQLERIRRDIVKAFTPEETPVTKHPETTTEWLEDIALELHAITGLLNERLPLRERDFQTKRADDLEGLLQAARADRDTWEAAYKRADDAYSRARDERDVALQWRSDTRDELDEYASRAERWAARHAALRADVERKHDMWGESDPQRALAKGDFASILDRDDGWGESDA